MSILLSAIIITKNETKNIKRCLRSLVNWVDEIIVIDSGSTDNTVELCQQFTEQVYSQDWPGYGPQKNRALKLAHGDWIFSIDADEWVTKNLRAEILQAINTNTYQGYYIPRLNMFCGRFQRYGDASRDRVLRLFRRECGSFTNDIVHEKVICQGSIGKLTNPLFHHSSHTLSEWKSQMGKYTKMTAELKFSKGKRSNPLKALMSSGWIFLRSYFLRLGFLDGRMGFIYAQLNSKSSFQKNIYLWRLRNSR